MEFRIFSLESRHIRIDFHCNISIDGGVCFDDKLIGFARFELLAVLTKLNIPTCGGVVCKSRRNIFTVVVRTLYECRAFRTPMSHTVFEVGIFKLPARILRRIGIKRDFRRVNPDYAAVVGRSAAAQKEA